jgi:hypothetical protein
MLLSHLELEVGVLVCLFAFSSSSQMLNTEHNVRKEI